MTLAESDLGDVASLTRAIGLTNGAGTNAAWFGDPVGGTTANPTGLKTILANDEQRDALVEFVDAALGPPQAHASGDATWLPLFRSTDPNLTVYAVLTPVTGAVQVGVAVEFGAGETLPRVTGSVHVPIFQVPRGTTDSRPSGGAQPSWLLLGRAGASIEMGLDAIFDDSAPVPGEAHLGGAGFAIDIPTAPGEDVGFRLDLTDLQLPGATTPTSHHLNLDDLTDGGEVGTDVLELVLGVLRSYLDALDQSDPALRVVRALAGALGLRDVAGLPTPAWSSLATHGVTVAVDWIDQVLSADGTRDIWLGQLADLVGGTPDPAQDSVSFTMGPAALQLGLRVATNPGGAPTLTPWLRLLRETRSGADVRAELDLLCIDTGNGSVTALPSVALEAAFGADAGGSALVDAADLDVGSVHIGLLSRGQGRPAFTLTLHDVTIAGTHHDLLDLSNPDAALDAADDVLVAALTSALSGLGDTADLLLALIGIAPPAGIDAREVSSLVTDPLGTLRTYYDDVTSDTAAATALTTAVHDLLLGVDPGTAVAGTGTAEDPWRFTLVSSDASPVSPTTARSELTLQLHRDDQRLTVALEAATASQLTDDVRLTLDAGLSLLTVDLSTGACDFSAALTVNTLLGGTDGASLDVPLGGLTASVDTAGVGLRWAPGAGLRLNPVYDALRVTLPDGGHLPLVIPASHTAAEAGPLPNPTDWDAIETTARVLLEQLDSTALDTLLDLVGWRTSRLPRLPLAALVADPAAAIRDWAVELTLDCDRLAEVMDVLATMLSAGRLNTALGAGSPESDFVAPLTGEPAAPGVALWTEPGCAPRPNKRGSAHWDGILLGSTPPTGADIVAALLSAGSTLPDLADLLVARDNLGDGIEDLLTRWVGTDGVIAPASTLPDTVSSTVLPGHTLAEASAAVMLGAHTGPVDTSGLVIHVGCSADWLSGRSATEAVDTVDGVANPIPPAATTTRFVRLPTVSQALALRPGIDPVTVQADLLTSVVGTPSAPVTLIGHGATGAACVRAANTSAPHVRGVITVGTPWHPSVAVTGLQLGLPGDALRLLASLAGEPPAPGAAEWTFTSAYLRGLALIGHARSVRIGPDLPSALTEPLPPGTPVHAVFGSLSSDEVRHALAAVVSTALQLRSEQALAETEPMISAHLGVRLPVADADLGGLHVGIGARLELLSLHRDEPLVRTPRTLDLELRLGVTDGWLVGGPGASSTDLEARWAQIHLSIPLEGGPGSGYVVLHEASTFGVARRRWVVTSLGDATGSPEADSAAIPGSQVTIALPEAKLLLSQIIGRVITAAPALADLLAAAGVVQDGGLSMDAVDMLLHDPASLAETALSEVPDVVAAALAAVSGLPQPAGAAPGVVRLGIATAYVDVDVRARSLTGTASLAGPDSPPMSFALTVGGSTVDAAAGGALPTRLTVRLGEIDPGLGGVALNLTAGSAGSADSAGVTVSAEVALGAEPTHAVPLYPVPAPDALPTLLVQVLPGLALRLLIDGARSHADAAQPHLDHLLAALGLLGPAGDSSSPHRPALTPWGLLARPGDWVRSQGDPLGLVVTVLDALGAMVGPGSGAGSSATPGRWPLSEAGSDTSAALTYAIVGTQLQLGLELDLETDLDAHFASSTIVAGLNLAASGAVQPRLDLGGAVDGYGARLQVSPASASPVSLSVVRPGGSPLPIYPQGPGLGDALETGASAVVVLALNRLIDEVGATDPLLRDVARATRAITSALGLVDSGDNIDPPALAVFVADPAGRLLVRLPQLVSAGLGTLADALDPGHVVVTASAPRPGTIRFELTGAAPVGVDFSTDSGDVAVSLFGTFDLGGVGTLSVDHLRMSAGGVHLGLTAGPFVLAAGPLTLRPVIGIEAGVTSTGFTRSVTAGVSLDDSGDAQVVARWALNGTAPQLLALSRGDGSLTADTDPVLVATRVLATALSVASGVLLDQLEAIISDRATDVLQDVLFTGGTASLDPTFITDLVDPEALFGRLQRLAWNCATATPALTVTIDDALTIAFASRATTGGRSQVGIALSLPAEQRLALLTGETTLDLEVDHTWIDAPVEGGLSIYLLEGTATALVLSPGFAVAGLGVRIGKSAGPLLELGGLAVDAVAVHVYAEANGAGAGGGARVQIEGLAISPGGAGGDNAVANGIMSDAGAEAGTNRPSFSPSLAIQKPPGGSVGVTLRAGDPPGPWWLAVRRQLGPLYLDAVGLDTAETAGRVSRITLLFNGSVSMFGLTAAVDQLSISWLGGDVLSISSWSVDLMGLAVSADMSGIVLSGGLLKTVRGQPPNQDISYVGMLVARFATYGLSVFGGYSKVGDSTSFFVFGAVVGPIGGPPAFFLTGLGGGFGINRGLRIPGDFNDFPTFPFLQALDPGASAPEDPMGELRRLGEYFPHQVGNFWFAAGISFTSFSLVDGVAVIAVSFGNGLEINLLGLARMALPRPGAAIVSIELALLARFSTAEGVFLIQAQLTENSWLLFEDVRLTGGFAFAAWWKGPLSGQFVLTLGGYHPNFHVEGYPVVPRLGLEWRISDALVIKGGAYFALTSEALMAGVDVEVSLDWGWVWARVAFGAHGIVYFDPFWFEVMAYARISAGINIKLGFFRIRISLSLGASITVWGPDFAGKATFEIGPCDVDVEFGAKRRVEPALQTWPEFVEKYLEAATTESAKALSAITGAGTLPSAAGDEVGAPSADGSLGLPFRVFAEFEFTVTTTIPATTLQLGSLAPIPVPPRLRGAAATMGLAPVGAGLSSSILRITARRLVNRVWVTVPDADLALLVDGLSDTASSTSGSRIGRTGYPLGVWGVPRTEDADNTALPATEVIDAGSSVSLVARAQPTAVGPQIDYYRVETSRRPLPLSAAARARLEMLRTASRLQITQPETVPQALALARAALYDRAPSLTEPRGAAGRNSAGRHDAVARARFAGERVAPPMPGLLTEGLAAVTGSPGERVELALPDEGLTVLPRRPFITAVLSSGAGAVIPPLRTTVADARVSRRLAPTTASVHGRLGRQLPVQLSQVDLPSVTVNGTVTIAGGRRAIPRTEVTGATRTIRSAVVGTAQIQQMVGGLGSVAGRSPREAGSPTSRAATEPPLIRSGDLLTLTMPDPHLDTQQAPPGLRIEGRARVVVVGGARVLLDQDLTDDSVKLPSGATAIAVHSDSTQPVTGRYAGWHAGSRLAALGADVALGAGCTLSTRGTAARAGVGWLSAGAFLARTTSVTTRFAATGRSLSIALAGAGGRPPRVSDTAFTLRGARRVLDTSGAPLEPVATTVGDVLVLTYAITAAGRHGLAVSTVMGDELELAGVFVADLEPSDLAKVLARDSLAGVVAAVLATSGPGMRLHWQDPPGQRSPRRATSSRSRRPVADPARRSVGTTPGVIVKRRPR